MSTANAPLVRAPDQSSAPEASPLLPGGRLLVLVSISWLAFGLLGGTVEYLIVLRSRGVGPASAIGGPVLASAIWIGLTIAARAAALRWPVLPPRPARLALHAVFAIAASFVLNAIWYVLAVALGLEGLDPAALPGAMAHASIRFLHLNAGAYVVVVLLVTLWERRSRPRQAPTENAGKQTWARTLSIRGANATQIIRVEDIVWIEGAGDYARLHLADGSSQLLGERLKRLESKLDPARFARVHRSAIVRRDRIRTLTHRSHGDYDAVLEDGTTVRVSRSRRAAIAHLLR